MTRPERPDASTPNLESLDAAWEEEEVAPDSLAPGAPRAPMSSASNLDDLDDGWETVPDPAGGPPQRRRLSPKERARSKRDKQRVKAELAASKQKGKKRGGARRGERSDAPGSEPPESGVGAPGAEDDDAATEAAHSRPKAGEGAGGKAGKSRAAAQARAAADREARARANRTRTIVMVGAALVAAAGALYFMMTHR